MLISFRTITVTVFLVWFSAFFVLTFPSLELHSAVQELWRYPLIYLSEVFLYSRLSDRLTLFGLSLGFIFLGSFCDRLGRYNTMLICLACAPFCATICGYFADAWFFLILHFLLGFFVGGVLVSSVILIFETVPPIQRWRMFSIVIIGGVLGAILSFLLEPLGWRSLYQIQLLPVFIVPILWHWSDEPLLWKFAVRDKLAAIADRSRMAVSKGISESDNSAQLLVKFSGGGGFFRRFYVSMIDKLAKTYFASISEVLLNRHHLLFPALMLTIFGICGLAILFMSFGDGVRLRVYQSYDLDVRTASRVRSGEVVTEDIDAALIAYIIEMPLVLELINWEESRIDLLPQVLRSYGYSRDDISGCVAEGLLELVKRLRGERITKELVTDRAVLRWNSKYGNRRSELDIPDVDRNRIKLLAGYFLVTGERTLQEIMMQNQQADQDDKTNELSSERRKMNVDRWQIRRDDFFMLWGNLLSAAESRYFEGEWCVGWLSIIFLAGCFFGGLFGICGFLFNILGRSWTQRRIFCVMFVVSALLSMMAVMLWRVDVPFWGSLIYVFIGGIIFVPFITCYLTTIPAMFSVAHRGAAVGFCFGVPLLVVFHVICVISVPYIYYLIPVCFVSGVFAIGIPARKKQPNSNVTQKSVA